MSRVWSYIESVAEKAGATSNQQMADVLGVSESTVRNWQKGRAPCDPSAATLERMRRNWGIDSDDLVVLCTLALLDAQEATP